MSKERKIREWYMEAYPSDENGAEIHPEISFEDLFKAMDCHIDVYDALEVDDSVIRERVFAKLAEVMGVSYEYVYNQWLLSE